MERRILVLAIAGALFFGCSGGKPAPADETPAPAVDVNDRVVPGRHGRLARVPRRRDVGVGTVEEGHHRTLPIEATPLRIRPRHVTADPVAVVAPLERHRHVSGNHSLHVPGANPGNRS